MTFNAVIMAKAAAMPKNQTRALQDQPMSAKLKHARGSLQRTWELQAVSPMSCGGNDGAR